VDIEFVVRAKRSDHRSCLVGQGSRIGALQREPQRRKGKRRNG
jgi:hypothetical protein